MTKRQKIINHIEKNGYVVREIDYSNAGYENGGWAVKLFDKEGNFVDTITGYQAKDVIDYFDKWILSLNSFSPPEPLSTEAEQPKIKSESLIYKKLEC